MQQNTIQDYETTKYKIKRRLLSMRRHWTNGSPEKPTAQLQIGLWLTVWQRAFAPQVPGHGSTHFCCTQARFCSQVALTTHSGRQLGALPMYPVRQVQTA